MNYQPLAVTPRELERRRVEAMQEAERPPSKRDRKRKGRAAKAFRHIVYERDGYRCVQCGSRRELTLDHVIPKAQGGAHTVDNLQTMCGPCNNMKADSMPDDDWWNDAAEEDATDEP